MNPFLQWTGGKCRIVSELTRGLPFFASYCEPFLGSGALYFALRRQYGAGFNAELWDANVYLINAWWAVRDEPEGLIERLRELPVTGITVDDYNQVRRALNEDFDARSNAARFLWLNRMAFNGLWRVNRHGAMNVPWNKRGAFPLDLVVRRVTDATRVLSTASRTKIRPIDFLKCPDDRTFPPNTLLYLDPPYDGAYSFDGYTSDKWSPEHDTALSRIASCAVHGGTHVMISQRDTPFIRQLYSGWHIQRIDLRHTAGGGGRAVTAGEVIIRSWK